jgi:hypothetical protein
MQMAKSIKAKTGHIGKVLIPQGKTRSGSLVYETGTGREVQLYRERSGRCLRAVDRAIISLGRSAEAPFVSCRRKPSDEVMPVARTGTAGQGRASSRSSWLTSAVTVTLHRRGWLGILPARNGWRMQFHLTSG